MSALEILLAYFDRAIAAAEQRATERARAHDWAEFSYRKRLSSELRRQREVLLQLLGTPDPLGALEAVIRCGRRRAPADAGPGPGEGREEGKP